VINKLVLENLRHRPVRAFLSILLIAVPVTLMLTLVGLSKGTLEDTARRAKGVGADIIVRPRGSSLIGLSSAPIPQGIVDMIAKEPHVTLATGTMTHPLGGLSSVAGVDLEKFNQMSGGFKYIQGGKFENPNDIIVDEYFARQNKVGVGGKLTVLNLDWRVCGVVEPGKLGRVFLPLAVLQDKTGNTGKLSQIYVKVDSPESIPKVIDALKAKLVDYPIYSMEELTSLISVSSVPLLEGFINVVVGVSIVISFSVVCLSMYMTVLQRTREIGILKSLGASRFYILDIILREAAIFGITGTVIGIGFSFATRLVIQRMVPGSLTQSIVPGWWPIAGMIALSASLLGAMYPGLRAALQDPIEALAYE